MNKLLRPSSPRQVHATDTVARQIESEGTNAIHNAPKIFRRYFTLPCCAVTIQNENTSVNEYVTYNFSYMFSELF